MRRGTVRLLEERAEAAGLTNVVAWLGPIEDFDSSGQEFDIAFGLHVCGEATDQIIMAAVKRQVPWAVSPCCIGGINKRQDETGFHVEIPMNEGDTFTLEKGEDTGMCTVILASGEQVALYGAHQIHADGTIGPLLLAYRPENGFNKFRDGHFNRRKAACEAIPALHFVLHGQGSANFKARPDVVLLRKSAAQLSRPRSTWLKHQLSTEAFAELASFADAGDPKHERYEDVFAFARKIVNLDRGMWAMERGYNIDVYRIPGLVDYAKDDLLVGHADL